MKRITDLAYDTEIVLPSVALRGLCVLPGMILHFDVASQEAKDAVEYSFRRNQRAFLVMQKDAEQDNPTKDDVYDVGTVVTIKQLVHMPDGMTRVVVEGVERAYMVDFIHGEHGLAAQLMMPEAQDNIEDNGCMDPYSEAMARECTDLFHQYTEFYPKVGETLNKILPELENLRDVLERIALQFPMTPEKRQSILSAMTLEERFAVLSAMMIKETTISRFRKELSETVRARVDENQRRYILREQYAFLKEELADDDDVSEIKRYEKECEELDAPEEVKTKLRRSISRYKEFGSSSEGNVERSYLETLLELPWNRKKEENKDLQHAEEVLNRDHYGLEKVKERVMEFLAVRKLNEKGSAPILCLVGPPGTGKTSIVRSIASALELEYVRICLGGVRDEAEIRGHRKTYIGAMPGRIVAGLKQAGCKNPVMLLDEIDKVSSDYKGDTSSALLEVLDPEQNVHFLDHYIEVPVDLSEVVFIATANSTDTIPRPLLDRMEIIEVSSYTTNEKFHIAKEYLVPKEMEKNGLKKSQIGFTDSGIREIIQSYTRESGVRELERKIGQVCRKAAWKLLKEELPGKQSISGRNLEEYLGVIKYLPEKKNKRPAVGIVRGLAWTSVGGVTLQVEVNQMPGTGNVDLTGQLGDVMKESAMIAVSYVRSVAKTYHVPADTFKKHDFHIHIPEGAVPKDGPSAGITMATAILSAVTGIPVRSDLAMTGELTLRGQVLPIGGLKEKILAAKMIGIHQVLVPEDNRRDISEMNAEILEDMEITFVSEMKQVTEAAFVPRKKKEAAG